MFFFSFEFTDLYLSTNLILKVWLYLNEGMTFDIEMVYSQEKSTKYSKIIVSKIH